MRKISWKFFFCIMAMIMAVMFAGCDDESARGSKRMNVQFKDAYHADDTWLVYWYVCGTDLETEYGAASSDIQEMLEVELPPNVKVLIQTGGTVEWKNDVIQDGKIGRYLYDAEGLHEIAQLPDADMGLAGTLADFLRYGNENFPVDHRVFIFWDHGGGSAMGVCMDERTGHTLKLNDIREAFTSVHATSESGPPFELIGFDACLMATYDVANTLYGLSRYMTASEEVEPGNGWNYTGWLGALAKNPAMGGDGLGQAICDSYMDGCESVGTDDAATLSVVDLSKIPPLQSAYEAFGVEALRQAADNPRRFFSSFSREAQSAENYGGNTREQGYTNMVDLGDLARESGKLLPETSKRLVQAIDDAVIYKVQGEYRDKGSGLSGFYSYDGDENSFALYAQQEAAPLAQKCLFYYLIYGEMPEAGKALMNNAQSSVALPQAAPAQKQNIFLVSALEDHPVDVNQDGDAFITLNAQQMDVLSSIHCNLIYMGMEDDVLLYLGNDADIDADWDKGIFKDNFRGVWPMLDGHPVFIEITAENDDYNLYSIPIKLNGVECNLQVAYTFSDQKYHILGARKGLDAHGMGDRNLIKLKSGDRITTIHYAMTISGDEEEFAPVEVETFTINDHPTVAEEKLGDGEYAYCFEFITPTDDTALSKLVQFTIRGEEITTTVDAE